MTKPAPRVPLSIMPPGRVVRLAEIGTALEPNQREQLIAYGLAAGQAVKILQDRPMTVILADEIELALEAAVARDIWVEG